MVHRTNHWFRNLPLTGPVPGKALVQRCLQPPAEPLQSPCPHGFLHQPPAPAGVPMGRIHKNVLASSTGAVDGPMEQGLKFTPGTLNASVPPQLLPQGVAGHHPRAEKRSEGGGKSGFPTAWWADEQMPLLCWFRQRIVCTAIAPALQSQEQERTWGRRNRNNRGDPRSFHLD